MAVSVETADYVLECINAYQTSCILSAACKLELFDIIHNSGPITAEKLVANQKWVIGPTTRFLDVLCAKNFLKKTGNGADATYENTAHAHYLRRGSQVSVWGANTMMECFRPCYEGIPDDVRGISKESSEATSTGGDGQSGGTAQESVGEEEHEHTGEEMGEDDWRSMCGLTDPYLLLVVQKHDLSAYREVYDLGGGVGNLARALCRKYPDMHVTVYEREAVVKAAKEFHPKCLEKGETLNVTYESVDFFASELPAADMFVACQVARHFTQQDFETFFSRTFDKLNPGGALMILESTFNDDRVGPAHVNLLEMGFAAYGSSFRTISDYKEFYQKHGFVDFDFSRLGKRCDASLIFGRKPKSSQL